MKTVIHFVLATFAYIIGMLIGFILDVLIGSIVLVFVFGMLAMIAGVFNGTGSEYIYQSASDGVRVAVVLSALYVIYGGIVKYPTAINAYFDRPDIRRQLRD